MGLHFHHSAVTITGHLVCLITHDPKPERNGVLAYLLHTALGDEEMTAAWTVLFHSGQTALHSPVMEEQHLLFIPFYKVF